MANIFISTVQLLLRPFEQVCADQRSSTKHTNSNCNILLIIILKIFPIFLRMIFVVPFYPNICRQKSQCIHNNNHNNRWNIVCWYTCLLLANSSTWSINWFYFTFINFKHSPFTLTENSVHLLNWKVDDESVLAKRLLMWDEKNEAGFHECQLILECSKTLPQPSIIPDSYVNCFICQPK